MATQMDRLWAPWRSRLFAAKPSRRCVFCTASAARQDRRRHVVSRGRYVFALLNLYPYTNGHLMIAPYRHVGDLERLTDEEWGEMLTMSRRLLRRLRRGIHPHAFNIGMNLGRPAGAGIPGHLHLHIVPRWLGDTNFMPVLTSARVISQSLDEMYRLLTAPPASRRNTRRG